LPNCRYTEVKEQNARWVKIKKVMVCIVNKKRATIQQTVVYLNKTAQQKLYVPFK
jgi:hypothetical protein